MNQRTDVLFAEGDLDATLRGQRDSIRGRVDKIANERFLNSPDDELVQHIVSELEVEPLVLYEDRAEMDQHETKIDVSGWRSRNPFGDSGPIHVAGVKVVVSVPYTGDPLLWKLRPNRWQSIFPRARVTQNDQLSGTLDIVLSQPSDEEPEKIKSNLDSELNTVRFYLEAQEQQIQGYNDSLRKAAHEVVKARRERLRKHEGIEELLGLPLRRREGAPSTEPIRLERKLVRPLPPVPKSGYKAEPGIREEDYEHILSVIRHEGRTFEATPGTYAVHDEEQLRDIVLAHLNGHYQGAAAGETFRRNGKTDIRIEDQGRAAFVAECKVWRGAKELTDAVGQLLSYLTWRDCKAALIIFNKHNARFSELLKKVPEVVERHPNCRKRINSSGEGEWRFLMTSQEDEGRLVRVHVYVFNVYAE